MPSHSVENAPTVCLSGTDLETVPAGECFKRETTLPSSYWLQKLSDHKVKWAQKAELRARLFSCEGDSYSRFLLQGSIPQLFLVRRDKNVASDTQLLSQPTASSWKGKATLFSSNLKPLSRGFQCNSHRTEQSSWLLKPLHAQRERLSFFGGEKIVNFGSSAQAKCYWLKHPQV